MTREVKDYFQDIIEAMENALIFVEGMDFEKFKEDKKTIYAVSRAIEIIGEAVKNIPENIKKHYLDIPWRSIAGMRDKLIHAYFGVNLKMVWQVVKKDIPELKSKFENILKNL